MLGKKRRICKLKEMKGKSFFSSLEIETWYLACFQCVGSRSLVILEPITIQTIHSRCITIYLFFWGELLKVAKCYRRRLGFQELLQIYKHAWNAKSSTSWKGTICFRPSSSSSNRSTLIFALVEGLVVLSMKVCNSEVILGLPIFRWKT